MSILYEPDRSGRAACTVIFPCLSVPVAYTREPRANATVALPAIRPDAFASLSALVRHRRRSATQTEITGPRVARANWLATTIGGRPVQYFASSSRGGLAVESFNGCDTGTTSILLRSPSAGPNPG